VNDLMSQLAQIQRYASGMGRLIADAQEAAPSRAEGVDRTGAVRVELGRDGVPVSFRVAQDWHAKVAPAEFCPAVMEAFQAAMATRLEAWSETLRTDGWTDRLEELKRPAETSNGQAPTIPAAFRKPATTRSASTLTDDMLRMLENPASTAPKVPGGGTGTGSSADDRLTISVSDTGLVSCTAEPRWVADQTAARLMTALSEALRAAKSALANAPKNAEPANEVDRLIADALGVLGDPSRLAEI